jgi:sugar phosphate isomerase/epimerase
MDAIAEAGYSGVEVLIARNPETRERDAVLALARKAGLEIPVMHGPYMLLLRNVLGSEYIEKSRRSLEVAAEVGAQILVAHAPLRWERLARWWTANEADAEAAELGVAFAMENLYPIRGMCLSCVVTPEQLAPFTHVVFDTSHFAVAGVDLFEAWDALSDRVVHLHVSDNLGTGTDSHAAIGAGVLPLKRFLAHVGASGWSGTITLELDCRAHLESRDTLVSFLARERIKAERMLAGELETIHPS